LNAAKVEVEKLLEAVKVIAEEIAASGSALALRLKGGIGAAGFMSG
jgi:hypothetical protein